MQKTGIAFRSWRMFYPDQKSVSFDQQHSDTDQQPPDTAAMKELHSLLSAYKVINGITDLKSKLL